MQHNNVRFAFFDRFVFLCLGLFPFLPSTEVLSAQIDQGMIGASYIPPVQVGNWPWKIGPEAQLFVDDFLIHSTSGIVRLHHQPQKYSGNPVLKPELPWERSLLVANGSIVFDPGTRSYRMYYGSLSSLSPDKLDAPRCPAMVAFSTDGLHWTKPKLGIVDYRGSKENNIVLDDLGVAGDMRSIIFDPRDPNPDRRWKSTSYYYYRDTNQPMVKEGLYAHFSPDGLHWTRQDEVLIPGYTTDTPQWPTSGPDDVSSVVFDPRLGKFVAWLKVWDLSGPQRKRARAMTTSDDFIHWQQPWALLLPDKLDAPDVQFYGMTGWPYESMWLGTLRIFRSQTTKQVDLQLISSRDGTHWSRSGDRGAFIPNGPEGSYDHGYHTEFTNPPLRIGDELFFYYGSTSDGKIGVMQVGGICLAKMRVDGFVSLQGRKEKSWVLTRPLRFEGKMLYLNADASRGQIKVELLEGDDENTLRLVPGFSADECLAIKTDGVNQRIIWKPGGDLTGLQGKLVRLKFHLTGPARLYSFTIR